MQIPEPNWITNLLDLFLKPVMFLLNGFKFPLQETHFWHPVLLGGIKANKINYLQVEGRDMARFGHRSTRWGLFHMPILGGLTQYALVEADVVNGHWHVGWNQHGLPHVHRLQIKNKRLKLLTGNEGIMVFGINDKGNILNLNIVEYGKIGDGKHKGIRLL